MNGFSNDLANLLLGSLAIYCAAAFAGHVFRRVRRALAWKRLGR